MCRRRHELTEESSERIFRSIVSSHQLDVRGDGVPGASQKPVSG